MKFMNTAVASLGLAVSQVLAAPSIVNGGLTLFKLRVSAGSNTELNGRYLALNGSNVGIFDGNDTSPVQVYQTKSQKQGCMQLHTYPVGIVDHSLGLTGEPGFLSFTDMVNPEGMHPGVNLDEGDVYKYDTFVVTDDHKLTDDSDGVWRAYPASGVDFGSNNWDVKWADGSMITTEDYMPIQIVMEAAGDGRYGR